MIKIKDLLKKAKGNCKADAISIIVEKEDFEEYLLYLIFNGVHCDDYNVLYNYNPETTKHYFSKGNMNEYYTIIFQNLSLELPVVWEEIYYGAYRIHRYKFSDLKKDIVKLYS